MKNILLKISNVFKALMPYMSLIAVVIGIVNICYIAKVQSDVKRVQSQIRNIPTSNYDNSDVLDRIEEAESNLQGSIEEAENNIRRDITLWSN